MKRKNREKKKPMVKLHDPVPARPPLAQALAETAFPSLQLPHPLESIFDEALAQVTRGKGNARHGHGVEFMGQDWMVIAKHHGVGFLTGQAEKKLREASQLESGPKRSELLGAIVYIAMAILFEDRRGK
jgi:hypothetical protein